jgi:hypothetical protein
VTCLQYATIFISLISLGVSIATFVLRWHDRRTNFTVDATEDNRHGTLVLTVINRGQREETISRLFLAVYQGGRRIGQRELTGSLFKGAYDLPRRIPAADRAEFPTEKSFLMHQMKTADGYKPDWYLLRPIAEDGQRKQHKGAKVWFEVQ